MVQDLLGCLLASLLKRREFLGSYFPCLLIRPSDIQWAFGKVFLKLRRKLGWKCQF
jgi:hypothetical protein